MKSSRFKLSAEVPSPEEIRVSLYYVLVRSMT